MLIRLCVSSVLASIFIQLLISCEDIELVSSSLGEEAIWDSLLTFSTDTNITDEALLENKNDKGKDWKPSSEYPNPIAADWFIYIDEYVNISSNSTFQEYFNKVSLNYTLLEDDFDGIWAAFFSNNGLPPSSRIRYPQISYEPVYPKPTFDFIEIRFFLHGDASLLVNTSSGPNPLITIDKTSFETDKWIAGSFSLEDREFLSVELRAMDNEKDCIIVDSIRLIQNVTDVTDPTTMRPRPSTTKSPEATNPAPTEMSPESPETVETTTNAEDASGPTNAPNATRRVISVYREIFAILLVHICGYYIV